MKFFLDTANIDEIKKAFETGMIDGVTTNPSLASKENIPFKDIIKQTCEIVHGPVSAEVIATDFDGMVKEAIELAHIDSNVVVKIPMTVDGIKAVKVLSEKNIKTNVTLVFSLSQALLAAKAGATYVSPFIGRLDDIGKRGMNLIEDIRVAFDIYNFETQLLAASIRSVEHVRECALSGSDVATIPPKIFWKLFNHELTDKGLAKFLDDWNKKNN